MSRKVFLALKVYFLHVEKLNWLVFASKVNITRERKIKVGGTVYKLNIKSVC